MDFFTITIILLLLIALALSGIHVAFAFSLASIVGLALTINDVEGTVWLLGETMFSGVREYIFVVLPLFTVMGMIASKCGAAKDLFQVASQIMRKVPGQLAVSTIAGNAVFAAVTGVGIAAAATFSQIAYPHMRESNYDKRYAVGSIAGSSVLGLLIPPSVIMIMWAVLTEQSIAKLFVAAVGPGLLLVLLYIVYVVIAGILRPDLIGNNRQAQSSISEPSGLETSEILSACGIILLIVVVLGGIWLGFFTPTEAAAVGVLGAALLARLKGMDFPTLVDAFVLAGRTVAPILFLMISALIYSKFLALQGVTQSLGEMITAAGLSPTELLLIMLAVWFVLGMMIDSISIMLLTVPVFWPMAELLSIEPVVFALIGILIIEVGVLTPPFGLAAFVVKAAVPDKTIQVSDVFLGSAPYALMILIVAAAVFFVPALATWLPTQM